MTKSLQILQIFDFFFLQKLGGREKNFFFVIWEGKGEAGIFGGGGGEKKTCNNLIRALVYSLLVLSLPVKHCSESSTP